MLQVGSAGRPLENALLLRAGWSFLIGRGPPRRAGNLLYSAYQCKGHPSKNTFVETARILFNPISEQPGAQPR